MDHMPIFLFTDFGASDIYVGQVRSVLHRYAPDAPVIDLLHEVPAFNIRAGAHLLAALVNHLPLESVILAVVDPGVGSTRLPVMARAGDRWFVGPDNGLMSVVAARAYDARIFPIDRAPGTLSASFHGRDLFAPVAGRIASGKLGAGQLQEKPWLDVRLGANDLAEVIYIDHYGNAFTGLRAGAVPRDACVTIDGCRIGYARVFSEVPNGDVFWYENSLGLVEIAANAASAAVKLDLKVGQPVGITD